MKRWGRWVVVFATLGRFASAAAQSAADGPGLSARRPDEEPLADELRGNTGEVWKSFQDPIYKVSFRYPANWTFSRKDGEISTFHLDARSAPRTARLRAVAAISENPFPASTFSGAYVYLSVTPHSSAASCARQALPPNPGKAKGSPVHVFGDIRFNYGHDEQKHICTTERDEVYTAYRRGSCYRFDLAINNFCGGEVSGVKDISQKELDDVRGRMEAILGTVRFDAK